MTSTPMADTIASTMQSIVSTTLNAITIPTTSPTMGLTSPAMSPETASSHTPTTTTKTEGPTTTKPETVEKMLSVGDLSSSLQHFGWADYFVFVLMLVVCAAIGFYFGFVEKKGKNKGREQRRGSEALDYLVGGRKMKVLPVSLSLVASFVSGISLLGTSTEIYVYGTQYAFILVTISLSAIISWYIFLPVFCNLQLTSTYEYFEMRFDKRIRLFGSALFTIGTIVWLPIVVYVPALAFNQVTGVNIHIITPVVCVVCIFYTMVGGLKAVVWTDVIQTFIMFGSIILVIIKGTMDVGGLGVVWQRNMDSGRIELPDFTLDHTARFSMLSIFVGGTLYWTQVTAGNQVIVQRFLSVPGLKEVKMALIYFSLGVTLLLSCCAYNGLLIFATYHDCDPLSTKLAKAKDQLVPLLVMDILKVFPGLPGLFVSGVFSAALSSLSTGLNSLSAVFLEDFVKPYVSSPLTERQTAIIMRLVVLLLGVLCVALVFVVERLGMVLQLSMTLSSITCGPLFGLFIMGLCMPFINSKYFEMRFDRRIRLFGSVLFTVGVIVWLPIAVYVPALTFNQVTGINIHVITPIVCVVCTFYTCVGGLKAVVWTDVIQSFVMFGSIFLVIIKGTMDLGGLGVVLQRNADSGRLNAPELSLDPTVRISLLSVFVGGTLHKLQSSAVNQITIQRFISLPSIKKARQTLIVFTFGLTLLLSCCAYVGLLTFATYHDCDPLSTKLAKATDQLVPLLVMHLLGVFPGLPGLFVSGVFSAALSSLSTGLNSLACVMLEDFIKPAVPTPLTERQTAFILRFVVAFFGLSCIGLVFIVEKLGMVLQLATTLGAVTQGPLLGIFFMGICMPWINGKSALTGSVVSFVILGWTCIKAQIALAVGELRFAKRPVSVEGCMYEFDNSTLTATEFVPPERAFHHISFLWYSAFGGAMTIIVACLASLYFGTEDTQDLDEALFAPCIRRFLKPKKYTSVQLDEKLEHIKAHLNETSGTAEKSETREKNEGENWNVKTS